MNWRRDRWDRFSRASASSSGVISPVRDQRPDKTTSSPSEGTPASTGISPALWALSIPVGIIAGLGAVAFRALIGFFHNLLFLGRLSAAYDANAHTPPSPWGPLVILVPVLGAMGVAFLVKNFAPEAKGHGVPEVMDAVFNRKGVIRPVVSVVKALASALSIGSGGSIGREGPIVQIGSSFGSTVGQKLRLPAWQKVTLIAAGAGGGIAATFNTPVGGILFAMEIVMDEVSARTLVPVITATVTATCVGQVFFGAHAAFSIPAFQTASRVTDPPMLLAYAGLGVITGLGAAYGVVLNYWAPGLNVSLPAFAVAGMAGVVGGATGAALAAIVMIFEMTLNYSVVVPMILAVGISYGIRRSIMHDTIYTRKLILRGEPRRRTCERSLDSRPFKKARWTYKLKTGQGDSRMMEYKCDRMREKLPF